MSEPPLSRSVQLASRQQQFLNVISRDEAVRRFQAHLQLAPRGEQTVTLDAAQGRVLSQNVQAAIDVPGFDRSNVDGFAVRSADTSGAMEESPRRLMLNDEVLVPGIVPRIEVQAGTATPIATGGMVPRGADAVLMIEHSELVEGSAVDRQATHPTGAPQNLELLEVSRSVAPGEAISFAGSDIARGETVLWAGQLVTSREIGVMAALGMTTAPVFPKPRVAVISTGDEIVPPGQPLPAGHVYDSNAAILSAAVRELGGEPVFCGTYPDDEAGLVRAVEKALDSEVIVLSGGTSKGAGDLSYRVVSRFSDPGIVAHGVALKPGKPICLAVTRGKPVVVLPGFPTSAIFTFHEFVAPIVRALAGIPQREKTAVPARLAMRLHSDRGRTEYALVRLFRSKGGLYAYPMGKGSGSVTTFSHADGFLTIPQQREMIEAEEPVEVTLLDHSLRAPDLVVIGSHCLGLDLLIGRLRRQGFSATVMAVGSQGGLTAARREECDVAGIHLFDPDTGEYNRPFVPENCRLVGGYTRKQCLVFRPGDPRFTGKPDVAAAVRDVVSDPNCAMVNRNTGSGTRILIDKLLGELAPAPKDPGQAPRPVGYGVQVKSHNAVAAAVSQGRADWGIAIETVAEQYGLAMIPWLDEHYDFVIPVSRSDSAAVKAFEGLLGDAAIRSELASRKLFVGPMNAR